MSEQDAQMAQALNDTRFWMAEHAPGYYSPEMTDEEVKEALVKAWDEMVKPMIQALAATMDEVLPGWRSRVPA